MSHPLQTLTRHKPSLHPLSLPLHPPPQSSHSTYCIHYIPPSLSISSPPSPISPATPSRPSTQSNTTQPNPATETTTPSRLSISHPIPPSHLPSFHLPPLALSPHLKGNYRVLHPPPQPFSLSPIPPFFLHPSCHPSFHATFIPRLPTLLVPKPTPHSPPFLLSLSSLSIHPPHPHLLTLLVPKPASHCSTPSPL